jgi:hypothetical protein
MALLDIPLPLLAGVGGAAAGLAIAAGARLARIKDGAPLVACDCPLCAAINGRTGRAVDLLCLALLAALAADVAAVMGLLIPGLRAIPWFAVASLLAAVVFLRAAVRTTAAGPARPRAGLDVYADDHRPGTTRPIRLRTAPGRLRGAWRGPHPPPADRRWFRRRPPAPPRRRFS